MRFSEDLFAESNFRVDVYTIVVARDATALRLGSGDFVVVRSANGYDGEGVYLRGFDGLELLRRICQTTDGKYTSRCYNQLPSSKSSRDRVDGVR